MTDDTEKEKAEIASTDDKNTSLEEKLKGVTLKGEVEIGNEPQESAVLQDEGNARPIYNVDYISQEFTTKREVH